MALVVATMMLAACSPAQTEQASSAASPSPSATALVSDAPVSEQATATAEPTAQASAAADVASTTATSEADDTAEDDTARAGAEPDDAKDDHKARQRGPKLAVVDKGDRGDKVERLQRRLAKLGFAPGTVDGAYGPRTVAAIKAFQMIEGLKQTGKADATTVAALQDYQSDVVVLRPGDKGKKVRQLQRRLAATALDPGSADGAYGTKTVEAVWALEKLAGVPMDGAWGPLDEHAFEQLEAGRIAKPTKRHKKRWVEFDLSEQVIKVYDPGKSTPVLISHGSSGSGIPWENEEFSGSSVTPAGSFVISRRIDGWRESSLDIGRLYNPLYFNGGIAFHGALSVPSYPASHGCIRVPMHIAEYLPKKLPNGTPVHVLQ